MKILFLVKILAVAQKHFIQNKMHFVIVFYNI